MVELDGITSGIAILVTYSDTKKKRFLQVTKNDVLQIRLFNNLRTAKSVARTITGIEQNETEYYVVLNDKKYSLKAAHYFSTNYFRIFDKESNEMINVVEKLSYKASNFSYIVFDHGDKIRYGKNEGKEKRALYFNDIARAIEVAFAENEEYGIEYIDTYKSEFSIHLRNSSASVHICTNSNIMDINQIRREDGEKVYPFDKSMDKFSTFYAYVSKDTSEPIKMESDVKAYELLEKIVECITIVNPFSEVFLKSLDYKGYILYSE